MIQKTILENSQETIEVRYSGALKDIQHVFHHKYLVYNNNDDKLF